MIHNMKVVELETTNGLYTWKNKRVGKYMDALRLDRFFILEELIL